MIRRFALAVLFISVSASARVYDTYRADSTKGAFCAAIAGACSADPDLESGFYQNPASLAAGPPSWNFDFDYNGLGNSEPGAKGSNSIKEGNFSGGIGWNRGPWAIAAAFLGKHSQTDSSVSVTDSQGLTQKFPLTASSNSLDFRFPIAYRATENLSLGFALSGLLWSQSLTGGNGSRADITRQSGPIRWAARIGGLYHEPGTNWSYGSWFKMPSSRYTHLTFDTQAYSNTLHYEEDIALHDPWTWSIGTRWTPWSDDRAFLFDFKTIGSTSEGYQLTYDTFASAFGEKVLRQKGRTPSFEPRLGYQMPMRWVADRKSTLLLGTFYEASRADGVTGRMHLTGGLSYELIKDLEFMIGADLAKNYAQIFLTFR